MNQVERPHLSLVIPCRNEAKRLPSSLDTLLLYLSDAKPLRLTSIEILLSIERSDDSTVEIAKQKVGQDSRFSILEHQKARGKGFNVRQGILAARGECILFMDADLSVPLSFIPQFLEQFSKRPELDVLIASRRHSASYIPTPQPLLRRLGGKAISVALCAISLTSWTDTQCGFKAFRRAAARRIFSRTILDGFSFDLEVLALAEAMRMHVDEYPVEWNDAPGSSVRPIVHGIQMIADAARIRSIVRQTLRQRPLTASE